MKKGDIVERGIGIAVIREINGEVATLSYMERKTDRMETWTDKLSNLSFICTPESIRDIPIPTQFHHQIEERNTELRKLHLLNAQRMADKEARKGKRKEKSEEEKKMDILLSKLSPSQILELIGG